MQYQNFRPKQVIYKWHNLKGPSQYKIKAVVYVAYNKTLFATLFANTKPNFITIFVTPICSTITFADKSSIYIQYLELELPVNRKNKKTAVVITAVNEKLYVKWILLIL